MCVCVCVLFSVCVIIDREFKMGPTKWSAFCKELARNLPFATNWYFENEKNIKQTTNNFQIDPKQVRNLLKDQKKIRFLKHSRKSYRQTLVV